MQGGDLMGTPNKGEKISPLPGEAGFAVNPEKKIRRSKRLAQTMGVMDTGISPSSDDLSSDNYLKRDIFLTLNQQKELDTHIFELLFEKIWNPIEEDRRKDYTYLDCLWFNMYTKKRSDEEKVMSWIKKKNIFTRKYAFVPIISSGHWSLLILCDLDLEESSDSNRPFMVLLDSLREANVRLEPIIRKFVSDIYKFVKEKGKGEIDQKMHLITPKVMQQKNDKECGLYVLYFMQAFLRFPPTNFSPEETSTYFGKGMWQNHAKLEAFCQEMQSLCQLGLDEN